MHRPSRCDYDCGVAGVQRFYAQKEEDNER